MTGQNRHNWPDFFCQGTFFEALGKGVAKGWAQGVWTPNQNAVSDF